MGVQRRAFGVHHFHQRVGDQRIEAAQRRVFAYEQMRFGTQRVNHACQLNGDIAGADDCGTLRQRLQFEEADRIDAVFRARYVGMARTAAGGDQNMVGGNTFAVHFHGMGVDETGEALDDVDVVFAQHVIVRGVNTIDVGAAVFHQRLPAEMVYCGIKAVIRTVEMDSLGDLRRVPHHFFRNTTHIHAGAAQLFGFNQGAFLAIHSGTVNRGDAAAAAANGEIVIVSCHGVCPSGCKSLVRIVTLRGETAQRLRL